MKRLPEQDTMIVAQKTAPIPRHAAFIASSIADSFASLRLLAQLGRRDEDSSD
jgi:hypothetical protein